jgi:hypothetical protein
MSSDNDDNHEKKEIVKREANLVDNFEGWEDGVEGDDRPQSSGVIQGTLIKFTNEAKWVTRDGEELPADLELIAYNVGRLVQKWWDGQPVETIILQPHQKFPDIEEMNEKTPREEWVEDQNGNMVGPWQAQHALYLLDPKTMDKYTFPTGTVGGRIAIRELRDKIMWWRRLRGSNVYIVITLADTFMNTKWGGRQRPHFKIARPVRLGGEGGEVEALPPPAPPAPPAGAKQQLDQFAKPAEKPVTTQAELPLTTVKEPSLKEDLNDEIPDYLDKPAEKVSPPHATARRKLKKPPAKANPGKKRPGGNLLDAG